MTGPTFAVNTQPVGCHAEPNAAAPVVAQRPVGTIQAMDQVITLSDGTWHREVAQQCWTRTQPGPVDMFTDEARARSYALRFAPPGTELYRADWSTDLNGWPSLGGWHALNGILVNDGTERSAFIVTPAPFDPGGIADYAVEAQLRIDNRFCVTVGLVARGWHVAAFERFSGLPIMRLGTTESSASRLEYGTVPEPGQEWHTYRLEVRGNAITMKLGGALKLERTDNSHLSGGSVGIAVFSCQVSVRNFRVIKL